MLVTIIVLCDFTKLLNQFYSNIVGAFIYLWWQSCQIELILQQNSNIMFEHYVYLE